MQFKTEFQKLNRVVMDYAAFSDEYGGYSNFSVDLILKIYFS